MTWNAGGPPKSRFSAAKTNIDTSPMTSARAPTTDTENAGVRTVADPTNSSVLASPWPAGAARRRNMPSTSTSPER